VSRGVTCEVVYEPLGVVAGIVPFNFPFMVPLWMLPQALVGGNVFVLKPSERVPPVRRSSSWPCSRRRASPPAS
jgi:malonate-semialdehyde dehydrogenase (acetylating)/methylmalonate-semialdehyde dehydrogenase